MEGIRYFLQIGKFSTCPDVFKSTDTARKQSQHNTGLLKTHVPLYTQQHVSVFVAPRIKSLLVTVDNLLMRVVPTRNFCWSTGTAIIIFRLRAELHVFLKVHGVPLS